MLHYSGVDCTESRSLVSSHSGTTHTGKLFLDLPSAGGTFPHFGDPTLLLAGAFVKAIPEKGRKEEKVNKKKRNRTKPSQSYRHFASSSSPSLQSSSSVFFKDSSSFIRPFAFCTLDSSVLGHRTGFYPRLQWTTPFVIMRVRQ